MDKNINIASRATLFYDLDKLFNYFNRKICDIWDFYSSYSSENEKYRNFVKGTALSSLYSALEILLNDAGIRFLVSYPCHINSKKTNDFEIISENISVSTIIKQFAEKTINELSYKDFKTYINGIYDIFGEKMYSKNDIIDNLTEGKASRDVFIHNDSKINDLYIRRAGTHARYDEVGRNMEISNDYLKNIKIDIEKLSNDFKNNCLMKYKNDTKENIFKEMWELSYLNNIVPFEKAWRLTNGHLSFNDNFSYGFSSSEKALYRFFKYIFHGTDFENYNNCISYALQRWRGTKNERIILSWLEYPFYL